MPSLESASSSDDEIEDDGMLSSEYVAGDVTCASANPAPLSGGCEPGKEWLDPCSAKLGPANEADRQDEHQERTKIMSAGNLISRLNEEIEKKACGGGVDISFSKGGKPSWTGVPGYDPLEVSVSKTDKLFNQLIGPLGDSACLYSAITFRALIIHRIERAELIARGEVDKRYEEENKKWPYRLGTMYICLTKSSKRESKPAEQHFE